MPIQDQANNLDQSTSIYLNMRELEARYQVTKSTIYAWIKTRGYPKPVHLGANLVRWNSAHVEAWENEREAA